MEIGPPPIHIPSSSFRRSLHSPEPSGTPDMERVSWHRRMDISGYGNEIDSFSGDLDREDTNIAEKVLQSNTGVESKEKYLGDACILGWNMKRVKNNNEQICFGPADFPSNIVPENQKPAIMQSCGDLDVQTIYKPGMRHLERLVQSYVCEGQYTETKDASNSALCSSAQKEQLVARMDANITDLVEKVTSLHLDQLVRVSNSMCEPVSDKRTLGTIHELQKILDLKGQITKEKRVKQALAQQLSRFRRESVKLFQHKEKVWESKYRELQKEKHALSVRLKKLEMQNPMHALAEGEDTSFTRGDMKKLQQEIEEQESLIKGYQTENERAIEKLREVELTFKEKEKKMADEIATLSGQLACLQASTPQKAAKEEVYASLCESLSLECKLLDSQAREATVTNELEMVKNEKKNLEKKIVDLEEAIEVQQKGFNENLVLTSDVSSQCMLITDHTKNETHDMSGELENKVISEDRKVANHGDKENVLNYEDVLKSDMGEGWRKCQSLQKKMEKLKREYEIRIRELTEQIQKKTAVKAIENKNTGKVKDLELQISQIRAFYMKKIKGLKEKLNEKKKSQKQTENKLKSNSAHKKAEGMTIRNLQQKITLLEVIITEKSTVIKDLEAKIFEGINKEDTHQPNKESEIATKTNGGSIKNSSCESDLKEGRYLCNCLQVVDERVPLSTVQRKSDLNEIHSSENGKDEEIAKFNKHAPILSRVCANCAQLLNCIDPDQELLPKLKTLPVFHPTKPWLAKDCQDIGCKSDSMTRNQDVNHDIELKHYIAMDTLNPNQQLEVLKKRVSDMEARQKQREREWQSILSDTNRLFNLEHDMTRRRWELALEAKSAEIERFKLELDTILEAAIKIQKTHFKTPRNM